MKVAVIRKIESIEMLEELITIENAILKPINQCIANLTKDQEYEDYLGFNFQIAQLNIKFRKGKMTSKKVGQFITLWKRNSEKQTDPFNFKDNFDFYIIVTRYENKFVFFFFPNYVLSFKL